MRSGELRRLQIPDSDRVGGEAFRSAADKVAECLKLGNFDGARYLLACMENFACAANAYDEVRNDTSFCTKDFAAGLEHMMSAAEGQLRRHIERMEGGVKMVAGLPCQLL